MVYTFVCNRNNLKKNHIKAIIFQEKLPMEKQTTKKVIKIVVNVLLWIFLVFACFVTILAIAAQSDSTGIPSIGGKYWLTVQSDSMSPTFKKGDLIIGEKLTGNKAYFLKEGDVISFWTKIDGKDAINTHRIVKINPDADGDAASYVTKGDNNVGEDAAILPTSIICKWTGKKVVGAGGLISFLQNPTGFLLCIVLPMALFFAYEIYVVIRTVLQMKNKGKRQITAAEEELIKQKAIEQYLAEQKEKKTAEEQTESKQDDSQQ
mgnify:CR=1 FL=1